MNVTGGDTNVITYWDMKLLNGQDATGLTITDFSQSYTRSQAALVNDAAAAALAAVTTAHTDWSGIEISSTNAPGLYRFDFPDAAFAAGVREVVLTVKHASCITAHLRVTIDAEVNVTKVEGTAQTAGDIVGLVNIAGYSGPRGPGIYLNDAAGNTNTVFGTDGTISNPVSTIAAAKTIADGQSIDRIYLVNDTSITLAANMADYEFVGIGEVTANIVNLGGQILTNAAFYNLTIEGDGSSSAGRIFAEGCALQDPGAGVTTFHIFAERCGIVDDISLDTSNDNVFDSCYSLVAGTSAPIFRGTGAAGTISIRHFSGGVQLEDLSASHNVSIETDGQVIFASSCNINANVSLRGNMTITDNTAGMNSLTIDAVFNRAAVNAEVVDVMETDTHAEVGQGAPPATATKLQMMQYLYKAWRNRSTQTASQYTLYADNATTVDQKATVNDDGTTFDRNEVATGP